MPKKTYTTFDLAKLLDVYPATIAKWIDEGKIKAFTTPGGHRRIEKDDLLIFLKEHRMPIPEDLKEDEKNRILIVDDDEKVIRVIRKVFEKFPDKYEVSSATDGFQAGQRVYDFKPDLVILDLKLPGIDGFEICKSIKENERTKHMKVIAVTGHHSMDFQERIMNVGADDYLIKPFDINDLVKRVEAVLG